MEGSGGEIAEGKLDSLDRAAAPAWLARRNGRVWAVARRAVGGVQARFAASPFARNVSILLISTVIGQAAGVLLSPLLTRIFSPEEFGLLSVFSAVLGILGNVACLRYEIAIPLSTTETECADLVAAGAFALVVGTVVVALACLLLPAAVFAGLGGSFERTTRVLLPAGMFVLGLYTLLLYTATWVQSFDILARARISQGVGGPVSQIVLGLLGLGATGLALGFIVGQTAGTTLLFKRMIVDRWAALRQVTAAGVRRALWTHRAHPLVTTPASVVDMLGNGALIYLVLAQFYPGPVAGYLFLAERVVARPLVMVSNSLLMVFIGEIGQYRSSDPARLRQRFRQITSKQFLLGLAWVVAINLVALFAFPAIFGQDWADAVPYLAVISAAHLVINVIQAVCNTLQSLNRQGLAASWQVARVVAICVGFVVCHSVGASALTAISVYSAIQVVFCSIMYLMIRWSIEQLGPQPA